MKGQKGQALPLAIIVLSLGALLITPFISHIGTSLIGSTTYTQGMTELYSCEAGIEYAIWSILSGETEVIENAMTPLPPFTINEKTVFVTIENNGTSVLSVTSTAVSDDNHSSTIQHYISMAGGTWTSDGNINSNTSGDVYVDGDVAIGNGVTVDGSIYTTGNVMLDINAVVTGDIVSEGDLFLDNGSLIEGNVSTDGTLFLNNNAEIGVLEISGDVYSGDGIVMDNNAVIYGDVYTNGDLILNGNAVIKGDVYIGADAANIILGNNAAIEGNIYIIGDLSNIQLANNAYLYQNVYVTGDIGRIRRIGNILGDIFENYTGTYPPAPEQETIPEGEGLGIVG